MQVERDNQRNMDSLRSMHFPISSVSLRLMCSLLSSISRMIICSPVVTIGGHAKFLRLVITENGGKVIRPHLALSPNTTVTNFNWKEYIIQTPFYRSGFWSLLLYSVDDLDDSKSCNILSGVIHVDKDTALSDVFDSIHKLSDKYGNHPILLPI